MNRQQYRRTINMKALIIGCVVTLVTCAGCLHDAAPQIPPSPERPMHTAVQLGIPIECQVEGVPLATECNEGNPLPWCANEDSAIDGTSNPPCFWRDRVTGLLWLDDGDGTEG